MRTLSNKIINKLLTNKNRANIGFKNNNIWNWITNKQLLNSIINCRETLQNYKTTEIFLNNQRKFKICIAHFQLVSNFLL